VIEKISLQELVIEIWSELLDLDCVGPDDEFLALGGNSIQAIQFISRFRDGCGIDVPLRMIFEHGSPSSIASALVEPT
jgi:mycobactin peptide synthetase MbtE